MRILVAPFALLWILLPSASFAQSFESFYSELRKTALDHSPELAGAQELESQKAAQHVTAWTRWMPRLDLQFGLSRGIDYSIFASGALGNLQEAPAVPGFSFQPQYVSLSRWALNLSFPIYRRSVHLGVIQSAREKDSAQIELENRISELDWRLSQLTGAYLLQAYRVASVQTSLAIARTNVREARLRFDLGERTRVDVIRAEASLAALNSQAQGYDQELATAASQLSQYLGITREELSRLGGGAFQKDESSLASFIDRFAESSRVEKSLEPYLSATTSEELEDRIARSSPVYQSALADEASATARSASVTALEWPQLDLTGSLNKQSPDFGDTFTSTQYVSRNIALTLTIPIFSGGSWFSTRAERRHADRYSEVKRERDVMRLREDVLNSVVQIRTFRAQRESQTLAFSQNEELVRLSQRSYQLGKTTLLELQSSQNDLLNSKLALAQTKVNLAVALRRLAWNLGVTE